MGLTVYANLLNLILEEGDFTLEEIVEKAKNRFGFNQDQVRYQTPIIVAIYRDCVEILPGEKYHKKESFFPPDKLLKTLEKAPPKYFEERPWMKKLYEALKEQAQNNSIEELV